MCCLFSGLKPEGEIRVSFEMALAFIDRWGLP